MQILDDEEGGKKKTNFRESYITPDSICHTMEGGRDGWMDGWMMLAWGASFKWVIVHKYHPHIRS